MTPIASQRMSSGWSSVAVGDALIEFVRDDSPLTAPRAVKGLSRWVDPFSAPLSSGVDGRGIRFALMTE